MVLGSSSKECSKQKKANDNTTQMQQTSKHSLTKKTTTVCVCVLCESNKNKQFWVQTTCCSSKHRSFRTSANTSVKRRHTTLSPAKHETRKAFPCRCICVCLALRVPVLAGSKSKGQPKGKSKQTNLLVPLNKGQTKSSPFLGSPKKAESFS